MLKLILPLGEETFDEETEKFVKPPTMTIELEHSLFSLSKWESEWEKPFLGDSDKTDAETLSYIRHMIVTPDVTDEMLSGLNDTHLRQVNAHIASKQTATWFREDNSPKTGSAKREIVTAEIIYHWLVALTIPWETQYWHLNRLLALVRVCDEKNNPKKTRQSSATIAQQRREINARRKAQWGTTG